MPSVALVATLILVLGCNTPAVQGDGCAKEDMKFGGTCYKFVKQPVSWTQAQKFCNSKGGNLLHSIDGETKEFLNQHLDQDQAWWVGQDLSEGGTSKMKPTGPPPWMRGSGVVPSASDNDSFCTYIILHPTFQLVTTSRCNLRLYFVCQKALNATMENMRKPNFNILESAQMMSFNQNPFTSPSKENITGTVASLSMNTAGGQIALSNLTEYIEITLPRPEIQSPPSTFLSTPGNPIIITLNITNPNDTVVLTVEPSKTIVLQLHLARGFEPTSKKYHFTTDLSFKKPGVCLCQACVCVDNCWNNQTIHGRNLTLLTDNNPCAQYRYLLAVYTGHRRGAGTSAKKPVFERGGVDMFLLTTPFSLGELQTVRLCHDNSGDCPAWYVVKVVVKNLQTTQRWHFLCNSWIGQGKGTGELQRTFTPAQKNEITSFRPPPPPSSKKKKDKSCSLPWWFVFIGWFMLVSISVISTFFTMLYGFKYGKESSIKWVLSMGLSLFQSIFILQPLKVLGLAIFFALILKRMDDEESDEVEKILLGMYSLSWADVMVGVQSALMMFPVNLLIVQLFRLSKTQPPCQERQADSGHKGETTALSGTQPPRGGTTTQPNSTTRGGASAPSPTHLHPGPGHGPPV
ncbi:UNVERIFIED_CONTAM: hypothetical protein FKN15_033494 [Acipenser sinensis]